jgi:hypothetical protein
MEVDKSDDMRKGPGASKRLTPFVFLIKGRLYWAPKRTETSFETPGSCMVTP